LNTSRWELEADFSVRSSCERVGIQIAHTPSKPSIPSAHHDHHILLLTPTLDFNQTTTLCYTPTTETFTIHRPQSPTETTINHGYESAPHTLFTYLNESGIEIEETLQIHAFFDKSVLEVFVNGRTVISTRVYYPLERCFGVRFFAEEIDTERVTETKKSCVGDCEEGPALLVRAEVWDGLGDRPVIG
jgi:beta-fructofuranosidase